MISKLLRLVRNLNCNEVEFVSSGSKTLRQVPTWWPSSDKTASRERSLDLNSTAAPNGTLK